MLGRTASYTSGPVTADPGGWADSATDGSGSPQGRSSGDQSESRDTSQLIWGRGSSGTLGSAWAIRLAMPFTAQKLTPPSSARHSAMATTGANQRRTPRFFGLGRSGRALGTGGGWTPGPLGQR